MQKIDIHFIVPNRLRYACLVARTVYKRGLTLAMWSSETKKLTELDELLWRFDDLAFLPHVFADDCHAAETPILLSTKLPQLTGDVLVLLADALPADWQKEFGRITRNNDDVSPAPTEHKHSREPCRAKYAEEVQLATYNNPK